jgi:putative ATP-dependent endonuclease of OLD family
MYIERLTLFDFRCFGPEPTSIDFASGLTAFVGTNGSGKTAVMLALQRMFGVTADQRRVRRQDFHVPASEETAPQTRSLWLEALLAFPELDDETEDNSAVPEFFHQMAAEESGRLKCRLRLTATWTDDGTVEGSVEQKMIAIRTFGDFQENDCIEVKQLDRGRIQLLYVPAIRDPQSQVAAFLRGRLWRAINWSQDVRDTFTKVGGELNDAFSTEQAVSSVTEALTRRWQEVHSAGTDTTPLFRPVDLRFQEFIRKVDVMFSPDEAGRERPLDDLSDGQRSLFHLALAAATLDIEGQLTGDHPLGGFQPDSVPVPSLTLIAVEEPENNLAPFYLSRIIKQILDLTQGPHAQAVIASHSASVLARVDPTQVRHFRLDLQSRTAKVKRIRLPEDEEEAAKFIREAVRTFPELYFARLVVLGEGASEEVVLPRLAEALEVDLDRSFVAVVPLGGRHVNHLWQLLAELAIPHVTLLDLDLGRAGGGWGRIKTVCEELLANGLAAEELFGDGLDPEGPEATLAAFDERDPGASKELEDWLEWLRNYNVFFCSPLDLDYSMLCAFPDAYQEIAPHQHGPSEKGEPRVSVLGEEGQPDLYDDSHDEHMRWYRYLFLGRGKPSTHVRVLSNLSLEDLRAGIPADLRALLVAVQAQLAPPSTADDDD